MLTPWSTRPTRSSGDGSMIGLGSKDGTICARGDKEINL